MQPACTLATIVDSLLTIGGILCDGIHAIYSHTGVVEFQIISGTLDFKK